LALLASYIVQEHYFLILQAMQKQVVTSARPSAVPLFSGSRADWAWLGWAPGVLCLYLWICKPTIVRHVLVDTAGKGVHALEAVMQAQRYACCAMRLHACLG
jgi:hypothetical protein